MGANGSGRYSLVSKAFDLADFCEDVLRYVDRALAQDEERHITVEVVEEWRIKLEQLKKQLKSAIEREHTR